MTQNMMNYSINWITSITFIFLMFCYSFQVHSQVYSTGTVTLSNTSGLAMTAKIDVGTQVTLTLTGPTGRWFALGFDAGSMASGTDVVGVHSATTLNAFDCYLTGYSAPVTDPQQNWTITSDVVNGSVRTIVATRPLNTGDANDYDFPSTPTSIGLIWARSSSATYSYSYHGGSNRGVAFANFTLLQPPAAPTGTANQTHCAGSTIAQLTANGTAIQWYANSTGGVPLASTTALVNGSTYYATQTVNGLESTDRLAVTVSLISVPIAPSGINGSTHFCYSGGLQQYGVTSVPGATSYIWTTPIGASGSSIGPDLNLLFSPSFQSGTLTVQAQNGCGQSSPTSIVINQHLQSSTTLNVTSCTPYVFNGQTYNQSGTYSFLGTTIWGCDSTVLLNLTISSSLSQTVAVAACGSYAWNGQTYFSSGSYVDTFQTANGCDSIVTLDLDIHPISAEVLDTTVWGNFSWNGIEYTSSGTYTQFFTSQFGCDSTVTINLTLIIGGLNETTLEHAVYPNPIGSNRQLFIDEVSSPTDYAILNLDGKIVQYGNTLGMITLQASLKSGLYYLQFQGHVFKVMIE
jgi:hypothetical protein